MSQKNLAFRVNFDSACSTHELTLIQLEKFLDDLDSKKV